MLSKLIKRNFDEYIQDTITNKDGYRMDQENFKLWLDYLETHPKATYEGFKKFKKGVE